MRRSLLAAAIALTVGGARAEGFDLCASLDHSAQRAAFVDCLEGWMNAASSPAMTDAMTSFRRGDYLLAVHQLDVVARTQSAGNAEERFTARAAGLLARKLAPCAAEEE